MTFDVSFRDRRVVLPPWHLGLLGTTVHLERMGSFPEDAVRMYVAELGSALSFLHERKIIHRYARLVVLAAS